MFSRFFTPFLRPGKALDAQLAHDFPDQLVLTIRPCSISRAALIRKHPIGAAGSGVDVGDGIGQQQGADLAIMGCLNLIL